MGNEKRSSHEQQSISTDNAQEIKVVVHGRPGITPQQLMRSKQNTPIAKVIYGLLTTFKDPFPGQRWLADRVPCSRPTVISRLRELELCGWLTREQTPNRRSGVTDRYDIYLAPLPMSQRAAWVQDLKLSAEDIARSCQRGLLDLTKSTPLTQSGLPKTRELTDKRKKTEAKDTDTIVSEQAPKLPPTDSTPKAPASEEASASEDAVSISADEGKTGADPPAKKTAPKTLSGFKEALRGEPPQDRAGYARACSGLVRRMTGYAYLKDAHQVDLIPLITKAIFKGLNGTGSPTQAQVERLYSSLMMAKDTLTPDKDAADVWPWMTRRVEAIMFSECVSVPPFDFRWTHKAPDGITWREKLCPKII